jgi:hypothetical protein
MNAVSDVDFIVVDETVWLLFTVQLVPLPPVITVPAEIVPPVIVCPIAIVPEVTEVTVNVVPDIDPTNTAGTGVFGALIVKVFADVTVCTIY